MYLCLDGTPPAVCVAGLKPFDKTGPACSPLLSSMCKSAAPPVDIYMDDTLYHSCNHTHVRIASVTHLFQTRSRMYLSLHARFFSDSGRRRRGNLAPAMTRMRLFTPEGHRRCAAKGTHLRASMALICWRARGSSDRFDTHLDT
jgi:hypothetical protein